MDEERLDIDKALAYLTLDEKIRMLSGDGMWHTYACGSLPRVRMSDGPNGLRMTDGVASAAVPSTCYPTLSMLANSFDPAFAYNVGAAIGREATAMGVNVLLAPGVNIKRSPFGGRNFEYFSEDPLLSGEMGRAYISGVQSTGVGACLKHFAANNAETDRMYSNSTVDTRALHEVYLKPFEIALEAKPEAVMTAYNKLNGEYCSQNKNLITEILRGELGFRGAVISDWGGVHDRAEALKAGLDIAMPDGNGLFEEQLYAAYHAGRVTEKDIDDSIRRILELTDNVYLEPYGDFDADAHDRLSYNAAAASIVMLKNESVLPLTKDMKITVCGELAERAPIQGDGSSHVTPIKTSSPLDAFSHRAIEVTYFRGYSLTDQKQDGRLLQEAKDGAEGADAVIVFVGAPTPCEGVDRQTLALPDNQLNLIAELTAAGHRVVVVLCSAGPVEMPFINRVRAVVYAGLNGGNGALVAVDTLFGRINPSGKLAESFPLSSKDAIEVADPVYRESIFVGYKYYDKTETPVLFPFGHGLSFSNIEYTDMTVKRVDNAEFDVTVTVENKSVRDAVETIQIYVTDKTGRVMRPVKSLGGYKKVYVEGETSTTATIRLNASAFEFYDESKHRFAIPDGEFEIAAAKSAADIRKRVTVKVHGNFFDTIPYPDVYDNPNKTMLTDLAFKELLGHDVPPLRVPPKKGEFTLDCCFADLERTFIGKIMKRVAVGKAKSVAAVGTPEYDAFVNSTLHTPLSSASATSDGALTLKAAKGIIELANGHIFKGLKFLLKRN
ncbi:MAG: glycosyl hydrolase [Clostridiales bacterium]|nr:glycosyl hydrolase [Clostridiales bacterium]